MFLRLSSWHVLVPGMVSLPLSCSSRRYPANALAPLFSSRYVLFLAWQHLQEYINYQLLKLTLVDVLQRKGRCWPEPAGSHACKNTSHRTARPDQDQRYCDLGRVKERFFKAHFSMSDISTPFPTWR